jgi:dolichol-phosphate mannosyltransferase
MKLSLIIPVFNESDCVAESAARLRSALVYLRATHNIEVILVDDGSRDDTAQLLKEAFAEIPDVQIISHDHNQGVGTALRTGFDHATGDILITTDFDGTYPFSTIPQLVARMIVDQADIVIGSPYHPNGSVQRSTGHHVLLDGGVSMFYRLLVGSRIYTWTSLFVAYQRHVIERIPLNSSSALVGTELLVKAIHAGFKVSELPLNLQQSAAKRSRTSAVKLTLAHSAYLAQLPAQVIANRVSRIKSSTNRISARLKSPINPGVSKPSPVVKK